MPTAPLLKSRLGEIDKPTWYTAAVDRRRPRGRLDRHADHPGHAELPGARTTILQQLQIAAFLGVAATGMMIVILLGHIDLSLPWALTSSAMLATQGSAAGPLCPAGLAVGAAAGSVNGLGVAYLRVPSMIFTLGDEHRAARADGALHRRLRPRSEAPAWTGCAPGRGQDRSPSRTRCLRLDLWSAASGTFVLKRTALRSLPSMP